MMWRLARLLTAGLLVVFVAGSAQAQDSASDALVVAQANQKGAQAPRPSHAQRIDQVNQNTVTIITGNPNGTQLIIGYDLSVVLDEEDDLRVLAMIGKGSQGNIRDVLYLRGIDLGITQTIVLNDAREQGLYGPGMESRIAYITRLFNSEMHVLAGPGIEKLQDLKGKKVNLSSKGSGSQFASRRVFDKLGINIEEVNMGHGDAYQKIKSGEIAATVAASAKPGAAFLKFKLEPGMKLLPVPYTEALEADFLPTTLTHEDYPNLLKEKGDSVDTIAFSLVLIAYNWQRNTERYRRLAKFVDAFFSKFEDLKKPPRHPKWKDVNLAAPFKGWKRFPAAQEWLDRHPVAGAPAAKGAPAPAGTPGVDPAFARVQAARVAPNNPAEQERLFRQFLEWSKAQNKK